MARRRLLVADDSATIQKVIKIAFSRHQYDIVEAASFIEALTAQSRAAADIVIADASLPGAHGPADFSKLTQNGSVPLLLLVGSYESVDEESFRTLGFSQFLKKPFESSDIVTLVDQMLADMPGASRPGPAEDRASTLVAGSDRSQHTTVIHEGGIGLSFAEDSFTSQAKTDPLGRPRSAATGALQTENSFVPPPPQGFAPPADAPPPPPPHMSQSFVDESKKGRKAFSGEGEPSGLKLASPGSGEGGRVPPPPGFGKPGDLGDLSDIGFMSQSSDMDMSPPARMPTDYRPAQGSSRSTLPPQPPPAAPAIRPEDYLDKIAKLVEDSVDDRLPPLVRKAIEDYCDRHFKTLAREVITGELRRLAEEKARHLVDN
jgi:CheY-like chemotaxis protein